jgi:hypothetical protein
MGAESPMTGPLLRFSDLDATERRIIEQDVAQRLARGHVPPTPGFYLGVLNSWGIMCPHPVATRRYEGLYASDSDVPFEECEWYDCITCGCVVINR